MKRSGLLVLCVAAIGVAVTAAQQQPPPQPQSPPPQFRATTDLVLIDVSVLDNKRLPVKGLKAEDFTILEDGVAQSIATFSEVDLPDAEVLPAKWMGRAPLDVQTNAMPDGRMVLIYMDERQKNASPFATKAAMDTAHAVIDHLSPKDVASVAFVLNHKGAQEFTTDRARLHAAVDSYAASASPVGISLVDTLNDLSRMLGAIPERRKVIFYIGGGQPFDIEVLAGLEKMTAPTGASPGSRTESVAAPSVNLSRMEQLNQYDDMMALFRVASRANVSIYTIDPAGLDASNPFNGSDAGNPSSAPKEFLRIIANATGARAVIGNNAPAAEVTKILGENASYYLIAFRSSNPRNEGKFRRIEVTVNRQKVDVRTRRGYVEGRPGPTTAAGVNPALGRLIPATQLPLELWAAPAGADPSGVHPVALMINVELARAGAPRSEHVVVAYQVVDRSGKEHANGRQELTVSPPAGTTDTYQASAYAVVKLAPGKYDIRLSAQSVERNRRGGMLGDVVVPDYAKDGLSASAVFVGEAAGGGGRRDELAALLSVTPTTERTFKATDPIAAVIRVYQAKQPAAQVTMKVTVIDANDKPVFEQSDRLAPEAFAQGSADYRLALPLAKIGSGQFLLRLEMSRSGAPAVKREVRFEVR